MSFADVLLGEVFFDLQAQATAVASWQTYNTGDTVGFWATYTMALGGVHSTPFISMAWGRQTERENEVMGGNNL